MIDYTNKDYASLRAALLQVAAERFPQWTDQSPNDLGVMLLELFAYMGDALFYNQDRIAGESFLETAVERRSVMQLLRLIGYELSPPAAASTDLTLLFADADYSLAPAVSVPTFAAFKTTAAITGTPVTFEYVRATPITIDRKTLPRGYVDAQGALALDAAGRPLAPPTPLPRGATAYRVYQTVPVVQVDANVTNEIVASSDGSAGQRYALARAPIVDGTLVVSVNEVGGPAGWQAWRKVPSLLDSSGTDTDYAVRYDENGVAWIEFGDGTYGKAPLRGLNNITATYCVGGGSKGNVPKGSIVKPVTAIDRLKLVVNVGAATGGAEAEDTAHAVLRGPLQFRSGARAVTASDYQTLATGSAFGIAKALALPAGWNTIRLVVAPAGGGVLSETLKDDLLAYLEPKRILTSLLEVVGPTPVPVCIDATVIVQPQFSLTQLRQQVANVVDSLLSFDNVEFNQILYISKLYETIQEIPGVAGVNITRFKRGSGAGSPALPPSGQLAFGAAASPPADPGELPLWQGFDSVSSTLTMTWSKV